MDFRESPEIREFRETVRSWIFSELTDEERNAEQRELSSEEEWQRTLAVQRKLATKGWAAPAWPKEYGGMGATYWQQAVFNEELSYHRIPGPDFTGVNYIGPTLMHYGTEEQKREHLPAILAGEERWCQGYSEPSAGSDLASLQTRAVVDGDDFVVNGQKIWTSGAHRANWIFLLARTDPDAPKHRGISYLIARMDTPGITVRPLVNMAGSHEFNEVFFEDVRIPRSQLVGDLNRGWYVGMATMDFERSALGSVAGIRRDVEDLVALLKEGPAERRRRHRNEVADRSIEVSLTRLLSLRILSIQEGGGVPNTEASVAKLFTSELNQRIARTGVKILGLAGQSSNNPTHRRWTHQYLRTVPSTIAGGTSEIQRNIIATRGLGLPRG